MKKIPNLVTVAEMYSGPGGLALGAHKAQINHGSEQFGFRHLWASDFDRDTCETFKRNFSRANGPVSVFCEDVRSLSIQQLEKSMGFMFGFPCNDFSLVGETKGLSGSFGPLYSYGVEYIDYADPLFFVAENVSGLSSANDGLAMRTILSELSAAGRYGYNVTVHLYKFEKYGVPQARHRFIFVGVRGDLDRFFRVPAPSNRIVSAGQALTIPPIKSDAQNHEFTKQSQQVVERLKHIKPGQNAWNAELPAHLRLNVKGAKLSHIYRRLEFDKPSYTVTGSGGGGTHVYHWEEPRALTNRERARLQTFPDDFEFVGSKESVRKQIGMAVPPLMSQIILEATLKTLLEVEYDFAEPSGGYVCAEKSKKKCE